MGVSSAARQSPPRDATGAGPVPLLHKLLYGVGYVSLGVTSIMVMTWIEERYLPTEGEGTVALALVTGTAFLIALTAGRVVDAVADPLIGYWSDRVRTRWGRRKPFIFLGGPLFAVMFALMWLPPVQEAAALPSTLNAVYLAVTASVFFFAFTVVVCPYLAMLPEITADPSERVSLATWQGAFNVAGTVGGMVLASYLVDVYGYRTMALVLAPILLVCLWIPLLVPTPVQAQSSCDLDLRRAVVGTLRNPWFPPYVVSQVCLWLSLSVILAAAISMVKGLAGVGDFEASLPVAAALLVAGALFPAVRPVALRIGKPRLLLGGTIWFAVMMVPLMLLGRLPLPLSIYWQAVLIMALAGPSVAALFALPNAMVADIVDHDEGLTGQRREAIYFGVQGLLVKAGMGIGTGTAGLLLASLGDTAQNPGGFIACPLLAMLLAGAAAAILTRYPGD
ncbi:MAG: MFS transporter [Armatimonadota bacterium]